MKPRGWRNHSREHALAAYGISCRAHALVALKHVTGDVDSVLEHGFDFSRRGSGAFMQDAPDMPRGLSLATDKYPLEAIRMQMRERPGVGTLLVTVDIKRRYVVDEFGGDKYARWGQVCPVGA